MKNNQLEQLLTELTPQEAAIVEGGVSYTFTLESIQAINPTSQNDPRVRFGNQNLYSRNNLNAPTFVDIGKSVSFDSQTPLQLFDMDLPAGPAGDDLLGQSIIPTTVVTDKPVTLGGYKLIYSVTA